jgi:hypothetical protein
MARVAALGSPVLPVCLPPPEIPDIMLGSFLSHSFLIISFNASPRIIPAVDLSLFLISSSSRLSSTILNVSSLTFYPPPHLALSLNLTPVMSVFMKETLERFSVSKITFSFPSNNT